MTAPHLGNRVTRMGSISIATVAAALVGATPTYPQEAPPSAIVRTSLVPASDLVVGQQVRLHVDILVETWFERAPQFPDIQVPNAIVLRPSGTSTNLSERSNGRQYAGIRRSYYIYAQQAGSFVVPSFDVRLPPALPAGLDPEAIVLSTETERFTTTMPPELADKLLDYAIATPNLTLVESYNRELTNFQIGDSIQRTISISASDIVGAVLPPPPAHSFTGLAGYTDPPEISNSVNRGSLVGRRTDTITYVVERGGRYRLPEIQVHWWNLDTQSLETEYLPGIAIRVRPSPQTLARRGGVAVAVVFGLIAISAYYRHSIQMFISTYRKRQAESEPTYFRRVREACERDDPHLAMQALQAWVGKIGDRWEGATIDEVVQQCSDPDLNTEWLALTRLLYGLLPPPSESPQQPWSSAKFLHLLQQDRPHLLRSSHPETHSVLPPLNPSSCISNP